MAVFHAGKFPLCCEREPISHAHEKLKDPVLGLKKFFSRVDLLKEKLGPILFQLPPNSGANIQRLEWFLDVVPQYHCYAFEFRNETLNDAEVLRLLRERNIASCPFHLAGYRSPIEITGI